MVSFYKKIASAVALFFCLSLTVSAFKVGIFEYSAIDGNDNAGHCKAVLVNVDNNYLSILPSELEIYDHVTYGGKTYFVIGASTQVRAMLKEHGVNLKIQKAPYLCLSAKND